MLVDVHNHFSYYADDIDRALADISEHRLLMVSVSTDFESYEDTLMLAKRSNLILPCFAIHPIVAYKYTDDLERIREMADDAHVLGEIGLDKMWIEKQFHFSAQLPLLDIFLESANKGDKVVILHVAGAESEVLEQLTTHSVQRAVIHDYYGPVTLVNKIIEAGLYFAFDRSYLEEYRSEIEGWEERLQIVSMIPDDRFLIETDGPNKPPRRLPFEALQIVAERVAELRRTTSEEIYAQSAYNFMNLIKGSPGLGKYVNLFQ
jgi:TatD DNase family protein